MITVTVLDDIRQLEVIARDWNGLIARAHSKSVFLTWEWVSSWLKVYQRGYQLMVVIAHDGADLCGIAPLVIRRNTEGRLEFIGQNKAYGEYLDFIVPKGLEPTVTPALCGRLADLRRLGVWSSLYFTAMLSDAPSAALIRSSFRTFGFAVTEALVRSCPYVELPATWAEYLQTKSAHFRRRLGYIHRRLERAGAVSLDVAESDEQVEMFFEQYIDLHNRRWKKPHDESFFDFHRRVARAFHHSGHLLLCRLRVGETVVALKYDFTFDGKVWGYSGGWLPEWHGREVGSALLGELIQLAITRGYREYDFLEQDHAYKRRWSTAGRHAIDLTSHPRQPGYILDEPCFHAAERPCQE